MLNFNELNSNNILELLKIDSTNKYANQLISAGLHQHSMVVTTQFQTDGKGQRGNSWQSNKNENLLMSIIIDHKGSMLESQFVLNMAVCLSICETINRLSNQIKPLVKWSNDIYINDAKVSGVLIENIIKGSTWAHSIIGIGLNVNAEFITSDLVNATSIYNEMNEVNSIEVVRTELIDCLNDYLHWAKKDEIGIIGKYNELLYKKEENQFFQIDGKIKELKIKGVHSDGRLVLSDGKETKNYQYGEAKQLIGSIN